MQLIISALLQIKAPEVAITTIASTFLILLFASILLFILFTQQKRKFEHRHQITNLVNTYNQEILKTKIEIQTQTMESISRELHDNIGTIISMAIIHLNTISPQEKEADRAKLAESGNLLNEAIDTLRDISKSLNLQKIANKGLTHSVREEVEKIQKTNLLTANFTKQGEEFDVEDKHQFILFRIIQEAINNVIKHSKAKKLSLEMLYSPESLEIIITDDGSGFIITAERNDDSGSGLQNMNTRAKMIDANFIIESKLNQGTIVKVQYKKRRNKS